MTTNYDLILQNANYYNDGKFQIGNILVKDEKIAEILAVDLEISPEILENAKRVVDASGKYVFYGLIDTHVHVREPGRGDKEDFTTGTAAALAGGVTTICQMPNVDPIPSDVSNLEKMLYIIEEKSLCDVMVYGSCGFDNREDLQALADAGVCGLKTFLQPSAQGKQPITVRNEEELMAVMTAAAATGVREYFHCEDNNLMKAKEAELHALAEQGQDTEGYDFHYKSRPDAAEIASVELVLKCAKATGCKVGIVHTSTVGAMELVKAAKAEGQDVTCEVCFHHAFFDESYLDEFGPWAKCNPPLRSKANVEGLWAYILDGTVDYIATDHAPHLVSDKTAGLEQVWKAASGIPHIEMMLPMLLTAVNDGKITLEKLAPLVAKNGYKEMHVDHVKGEIAVGFDADFAILDIEKANIVDSQKFFTKGKDTCKMFDGIATKGAVYMTILRGKVLFENSEIDFSAKGYGKFLPAKR